MENIPEKILVLPHPFAFSSSLLRLLKTSYDIRDRDSVYLLTEQIPRDTATISRKWGHQVCIRCASFWERSEINSAWAIAHCVLGVCCVNEFYSDSEVISIHALVVCASIRHVTNLRVPCKQLPVIRDCISFSSLLPLKPGLH